MIYITLGAWLVAIVLMASGVYRLWSRAVPAHYLNWVLLPGTVVGEMAYIFGCLITGGEVRRAKLIPSRSDGETSAATDAEGGMKLLGSLAAAALSVVACVAVILAARALLGNKVIDAFVLAGAPAELPQHVPAGWDAFWAMLTGQVELLRRLFEALADADWTDWKTPVFIYLALCMSVRLAPAGRDLRPTLLAVIVLSAIVAAAGAIGGSFEGLVGRLWPLLAYVWATLLALLALTAIAFGLARLVRVLQGKSAG